MTPSICCRILPALLLALLLVSPVQSHAADPVPSAEAAVQRFRTACDGELAKAVPPETMKRINLMRESPFLMIARKSHVDVTEFLDPTFAAAIAKNALYGSQTALTQSTGDIWVLTYGNMRSTVVYLDATSGAVLCIAVIPEG
ncbi:MAG: hypothetical protein P4L99_16480 [Chthoniobacter sp.]|nr:hypothetical protein [Chthoniobacter sp.]